MTLFVKLPSRATPRALLSARCPNGAPPLLCGIRAVGALLSLPELRPVPPRVGSPRLRPDRIRPPPLLLGEAADRPPPGRQGGGDQPALGGAGAGRLGGQGVEGLPHLAQAPPQLREPPELLPVRRGAGELALHQDHVPVDGLGHGAHGGHHTPPQRGRLVLPGAGPAAPRALPLPPPPAGSRAPSALAAVAGVRRLSLLRARGRGALASWGGPCRRAAVSGRPAPPPGPPGRDLPRLRAGPPSSSSRARPPEPHVLGPPAGRLRAHAPVPPPASRAVRAPTCPAAGAAAGPHFPRPGALAIRAAL